MQYSTLRHSRSRPRRFAVLCATALTLAVPTLHAQAPAGYPDKQIRMIVPFPAGGPTDALARAIGQALGQRLRQPVVVENRAGAGGSIGAEMVARAEPTGYTLMMTSAGVVTVNPSLSKVPFDTLRDFAPVALAATISSILVVPPSLNVKSVRELVDLARSKPGQLNYGSSGTGSASHLAMELFDRMAGVHFVHVPYKGAAPAVTDLVAGNVQVMLIGSSTVMPFVRAGKLVPLGVSSLKPSPLAPDIPVIASPLLPGFEVGNWFGVFAPAHTAPSIVERLNVEINAIMKLPELKAQLARDGFEAVAANTPAQFGTYVKEEVAKWSRVVKEAGITN